MEKCCAEARFTEDGLCWGEIHGQAVPVEVGFASRAEWVAALRKWRDYADSLRRVAETSSTNAVAAVRSHVMHNLDKGVTCPGCHQHAQAYKRKLNAGQAKSLIDMYRAGGKGWVDVTEVTDRRSREEGKLAYWGLVEEFYEGRPDGGRPGLWRVTDLGEQFVLGKVDVQSHAKVYNGQCLGLYGQKVSIATVLGTRFNYAELMAGV